MNRDKKAGGLMHLYHLLSELKDHIPCNYHTLHMVNTNTIYSDYPPEWVNFYTQNQFEKRDPALIESQKTPLPFYWDYDMARSLSPKKQHIFNKAQDFKIYCGISMMNIHEKCIITLSSQDKHLSLPTYDYLCMTLAFLNFFSILSESTVSLSKADINSLFKDFIKMREKVSTRHHTPLFQALHHLQMSRLYLNKTVFSSEKESAMKDLSQSAHLMSCFIDSLFKTMHNHEMKP